MAKLKIRPVSAGGPVPPDAPTVTLAELIGDGRRPGPREPARDALWLKLRSEVAHLTLGTRFDLRRMTHLRGAELDTWLSERRQWLAERLAGDPRIAS